MVGTGDSVLIREVSSIQSVLYREAPLHLYIFAQIVLLLCGGGGVKRVIWPMLPPTTAQGSGKTYTLGSGAEVEWNGEREGMIPRALNDIFKGLQVNSYVV